MSRDFVTQMRLVVDQETPTGSYYPGEVAERVVQRLRKEDPDLLFGWLDEQAEEFVRMMINKRDHSARTHARRRVKEWAFAKAVKDGDVSEWLSARFTVEDGQRVPLAKMTRMDLIFVSTAYDRTASTATMEKFFFEALAKKVPLGKTVGEVFDETKLIALRRKVFSS